MSLAELPMFSCPCVSRSSSVDLDHASVLWTLQMSIAVLICNVHRSHRQQVERELTLRTSTHAVVRSQNHALESAELRMMLGAGKPSVAAESASELLHRVDCLLMTARCQARGPGTTLMKYRSARAVGVDASTSPGRGADKRWTGYDRSDWRSSTLASFNNAECGTALSGSPASTP